MESLPNLEQLRSSGKEIYKDDPQAGMQGEHNSIDIELKKHFKKFEGIIKQIQAMYTLRDSPKEREIFNTYKDFTKQIDDLTRELQNSEGDLKKQESLIQEITFLESELETFLNQCESIIDIRGIFEPHKNEA